MPESSDGNRSKLDEAIDLVEELVCQACWSPDKEGAGRDYGHSFISTYEWAMVFLEEQRPERWSLTPWGITLNESSDQKDALPEMWDADECRCVSGMHTCGKPNESSDQEDAIPFSLHPEAVCHYDDPCGHCDHCGFPPESSDQEAK